MIMKVQVSCYSGRTYAERPKSFMWEGKGYKVEEVEKEWREPGRKFFKVTTDGGKLFELYYDEAKDIWSAVELAE